MQVTLPCFVSLAALTATTLVIPSIAVAQTTPAVEFDVVSIKKHTALDTGGGMRTLPDGTFMMTNSPIRSVILSASPVRAREVLGLPDWVSTERYDMTLKPPANSAREQLNAMWRAMFADRMKLVGHIEEQERNTFALVLARGDGRLGPQIKSSTLDCSPRGSGPPASPTERPTPSDFKNRCGMMFGPGSIVSGGITLDALVNSLAGLAGGQVFNQTGLQGAYALELTFSTQRVGGAPDPAATADDAPGIFTAVQEQLGLKLVPQKTKEPIFVVDHIERPTDN